MKGDAVQTDDTQPTPDQRRDDDEFSYSILKNCLDLGVEREAAEQMVERFLENRRKPKL